MSPIESPLPHVERFLSRFIVLPKESDYFLITLWIAHTYFTDILTTTPRLGFLSPEYGCGKSRCLEVIHSLSFESVSLDYTTRAFLMRKTDQIRQKYNRPPTLLIDEVDTVWNGSKNSDASEALRAIVNSGYRQGATYGVVEEVTRNIGGKTVKKREPVDFEVFAPLAYAGKGDRAPQSVKSRSIEIRLQKRTASELIEDFQTKAVKSEAEGLKEWLGDWADAKRVEVEWENVTLPRELIDRDRELLLPLYAVAQVGGWGEEFLQVADTFHNQKENEETPNERKILSDCLEVFHYQGSSDRITSKELIKGLNALEDGDYKHWNRERGITNKTLSKTLRLYGIESQDIRFGEKIIKGYYRQPFEVAVARYIQEESSSSHTSEATSSTEATEAIHIEPEELF